jgi:hypothetical protein
MITSFFAPKSKTGRKRTAEDEQRGGSGFRTKKFVMAPPSESSSASEYATTTSTSRRTPTPPRPPSEEASALLSFLCDEDEEGGRRLVPDWRSSLEMHFATSTFSSLAKFVARERCVFFSVFASFAFFALSLMEIFSFCRSRTHTVPKKSPSIAVYPSPCFSPFSVRGVGGQSLAHCVSPAEIGILGLESDPVAPGEG